MKLQLKHQKTGRIFSKWLFLPAELKRRTKALQFDVRLLAEISTVGVGFWKTHTTVLQSIWHFRSKNGYAIFHCYEYYLDSLHSVSINCNETSVNCSDTFAYFIITNITFRARLNPPEIAYSSSLFVLFGLYLWRDLWF